MRPNFLSQALSVRPQRGAATIVVAVIILVLVTLLVFMSSRSTLMNSRLSNNDYKARQAFEAAESGLDFALDYFKREGLKTTALTNFCASPSPQDAKLGILNTPDSPGFSYTIDGQCGAEFIGNPAAAVRVAVQGFSADGQASRTVEAVFAASGALPSSPSTPVTAASNAGSLGSATIENAFSNITVRSGSTTSVGGSATTFICDRCGDQGAVTSLEDLYNSGSNLVYRNSGVDIIEDDPVLAGMTNDDFFNGFFATSRDNIDAFADIVADSTFDISQDPETGLPYMGKVIVVHGDLSIAANTRIGCSQSAPTVCVYPNDIEPVTLIVFGDLAVAGTVDFYGFVYVAEDENGNGGDIRGNGNFLANGAVALEGEANISGNFTLRYHPQLAGGSTGTSGGIGLNWVSGTWKDF